MSTEDEIIGIMIAKSVELTAKGYTLAQADSAIKRSRRWAESISAKVPANKRPDVYLELFKSSLSESEDWLDSLKNSGRAWKSGLEQAGFTVGPKSQGAYESFVGR